MEETRIYIIVREQIAVVTLGEECWKLGSTGIEAVPELQSNHEEADTRMILHGKHVQGPCIIHADDIDVLVLILSHSNTLDAAYMKAGRGSKSRIINIKSMRDQIAKDFNGGSRQNVYRVPSLKNLTKMRFLSIFIQI